MKSFIAICILVAAVSAEFVVKTPVDLAAARTKCFEETKVPDNFIEEIKKFNYPNEEIVHKYMLCSSKTLGFFDETTGYNVDYLVEQFGKDARPLIEKCIDKNEQKTSVDEWAWRNYKCMVDAGILKTVKETVAST